MEAGRGEQAVATASGMAAILTTVMSLCSAGDHILVSRSVFGATVTLFEKYFKRFGIEVDYVPLTDTAAWRDACKPNTRMFFIESPSNPLAELGDIGALGAIARELGSSRPLIVTDTGLKDLYPVQHALEALRGDGFEVAVFSDVKPNPTGTNVADLQILLLAPRG